MARARRTLRPEERQLMEREANYSAVGAFVILVTVMAGLFVYWYSEGRDRRSYTNYEIYFPGSVTGLSEGGSVRYLGVEVGKIRRIRLDARSAERVQVVVEIDQAAPVSERTTAELSMMSLATGLLYIDLKQNTSGREVLPPVPSDRHPVINTVRSNFDTFLDSLPDLAGSTAVLLDRAQEIFSHENSAALADMVKNLHGATLRLPQTMNRADTLLADLDLATNEARKLIAALQHATVDLSPQVVTLLDRLNTTAGHLEKASAEINRFVENNSDTVSGFAQQGLPQLQRTLEEARSAAESFRELTRSLKDNPSQLIYQPARGGVEVPR
jgi:phospholipid/cholesterol/gamma-HCH transport system substrate-binding protein